MHKETAAELEYYLTMLKVKGENYTFQELKKLVKSSKRK